MQVQSSYRYICDPPPIHSVCFETVVVIVGMHDFRLNLLGFTCILDYNERVERKVVDQYACVLKVLVFPEYFPVFNFEILTGCIE